MRLLAQKFAARLLNWAWTARCQEMRRGRTRRAEPKEATGLPPVEFLETRVLTKPAERGCRKGGQGKAQSSMPGT